MMKTYAMYQGERVQVVGASAPMVIVDGTGWYLMDKPIAILIKFEGETRFHSLEVSRDELNDFEYESEDKHD